MNTDAQSAESIFLKELSFVLIAGKRLSGMVIKQTMEFKDIIGNVTVKELPSHCSDCPFHSSEYFTFTCQVTGRKQDDSAKMRRMRGCPLRKTDSKQALDPIVDKVRHRRCPKCNTILKGRYCHECGQAVKW